MKHDKAQPTDELHTLHGTTRHGKPCRIVDNTRTIERTALACLLSDLITADKFGLRALSAPGENTLILGEPELAHIQIADQLYRLTLYSYEAHIEQF